MKILPLPLQSSTYSATSPSYDPGDLPGDYLSAPLGPSLRAQFQREVSGPGENVEESYDLVSDLATLQLFSGMFKADRRIFAWLGLKNRRLENGHADADFVVTVAIIVALKNKFPVLIEEWEFMVAKAKEAIEKLYSEGDRVAVESAVRAALGL